MTNLGWGSALELVIAMSRKEIAHNMALPGWASVGGIGPGHVVAVR